MIVTEGGTPYVIGTRLYLHQGKVIRVDSLVIKTGDWLFNANAFLQVHEAGGLDPAVQVLADRSSSR